MAETEPTGSDTGEVEPPRRRLGGLARAIRYRLVIPIARGRKDGVPTARGTAIGLGIGLTPTVGIQMPLIAVFWAFMKWFRPDWKFNLIVALAWTWPTNIVTAPFCYYAFLITGRLMMGESPSLGFSEFHDHIVEVLSPNAGFFESLWIYTVGIFRTWGIPMFVGSVPWAIGGAWAGYVLTLKFIAKLRESLRKENIRRHERLARKRAAQARARAAQT